MYAARLESQPGEGDIAAWVGLEFFPFGIVKLDRFCYNGYGKESISVKGFCAMMDILSERGINWLVHFTQAGNLSGIFSYGLLPRADLINNSIPTALNDHFRYDRCDGAVCTSIEFPNYRMFFKLRMDNPSVDWVVLRLDASIMYQFDCAFCTTNAGSEESYTIPLPFRKGREAFIRLFDELPHGPSRLALGIPYNRPTNPQAEVLVFGVIPVSCISGVYFESNAARSRYIEYVPQGIEAKINSKAFAPRPDWQHWQPAN